METIVVIKIVFSLGSPRIVANFNGESTLIVKFYIKALTVCTLMCVQKALI